MLLFLIDFKPIRAIPRYCGRILPTVRITQHPFKAISRYFKGDFDASTQATKARFLQEAANYGLLHLAMHGQADLENAKFGNLIFTNQGSEDNLLYHYEIANLQLNAQLAVLSACETGLGKYEAGEGVFSLARSFMYAGVPSVVMSLWKVNDQTTSQLMPKFYKNLSKGKKKDKALHEAKLAYLNESNLEYRHPYYWAGFVALGDVQPLKRPFPMPRYLGGLGIFLLALIGFRSYRNK